MRLVIKRKELDMLKIRSVAIKSIRRFPFKWGIVKRIGMWIKKKRILAVKVEVKAFFESSYNLFKIKPRESISSVAPVASEVIRSGKKENIEIFPFPREENPPCFK